MHHRLRRLGVVLIAAVCLGGLTACSKPDSGQIGIVRNGGPFDDKDIRGILCPNQPVRVDRLRVEASATTPTARSSGPTSSTTTRARNSKPIENLRTADGVKVTLSGTVYFKTRFELLRRGPEARPEVRPGERQPAGG